MMYKVAIVGVSGFTGFELIKMLITHPDFTVTYLANSEGDTSIDDLHPSLKNVFQMDVQKADAEEIAQKADVAILALPHKSAMGFTKELIKRDVKVIDLSADYRLDLENYESNYCVHEDEENLKNAGYAIPELYRESLQNRFLISSPGCYPTATLLALAPFLSYIEENQNIFIDAKSGVSGAGKKCIQTTHFATINENIFTYNPLLHRHSIEIEEKLQKLSGKKLGVNFVPHLIPITRGMLVSAYFETQADFDPIDVLDDFYSTEKFIRIKNAPVDVKSVSGTHFCDIYAIRKNNVVFISSAIDNLLRGAASQAIAALNIMFDLEEDTALPKIAYVP